MTKPIQESMFQDAERKNDAYDIISHNTELKMKYNDQFHQTFGISLFRFMHPLFGFDAISFDENFIRPPEGTSTYEQIRKVYGEDAVKLIEKLIDAEEKS